MESRNDFRVAKAGAIISLVLTFCLALQLAAQSPAAQAPAVPDWAQPGSRTHTQVPPPANFHRATTTFDKSIGIFDGQSDIGSAVVPGSAAFDPAANQYT